MRSYTPTPLDTSAVTMPAELQSMLEQLAQNTHEVWAARRVADGWAYGPTRDDTAKHHPCLVPYAELTESEKDYDRSTALEALKFVLALEYTITPPGHCNYPPKVETAMAMEPLRSRDISSEIPRD